MSDHDFYYLLPPVKGSVLSTYLAQTFKIKSPLENQSPARLFAYNYQQHLPESYQKTLQRFPSYCFDIAINSTYRCFLIITNERQFFKLLDFASSLACKILADHINKELSPQFSNFQIQDRNWNSSQPKIMAILNITPDSFYDGGKFFQKEQYGDIAMKMVKQGIDLIDIGGESTRPGSKPVSAREEIQRVLPVVQQIRSRFSIPISVDTVKPEVAEVVLENGADMINDTSGLSGGEEMLEILKNHKASYCLMHIQGVPETMQETPAYSDVIADVYRFFRDKLQLIYKAGLLPDRICIDPGIGFGKSLDHNIFLLRYLSAFRNLNRSILLGTSNKSFIGKILASDTDHRLAGSLTTQVIGYQNGASIFRVHNLKETNDALKIMNYFE